MDFRNVVYLYMQFTNIFVTIVICFDFYIHGLCSNKIVV